MARTQEWLLVGKGKGEGARQQNIIKRGKPLHIKEAKKDILYSKGNIIICNNFKWNIIYKNTKSLCCTPETNIVN